MLALFISVTTGITLAAIAWYGWAMVENARVLRKNRAATAAVPPAEDDGEDAPVQEDSPS